MPTDTHTQRGKLEGILGYVRERHGSDWRVQLDLGGFVQQRLRDFHGWKCDGVIAYINTPSTRRQFISARLPTVLIEPFLSPHSPIRTHPRIVTFVNDHAREGRTAAEHFLSLHFKSFAFVGTAEITPWSRLRLHGFRERLRESGMTCRAYPNLPEEERADFALEMTRLVKWLKTLPRPTALFAAHDIRARQVLTAADAAGIDVPSHVAVLGVDDDELICETSSPALSSIPTQDRSLGYACGRALDELFKGHPGNKAIRTAHTHVVCRASTDTNAVEDPFVARALVWARKNLSSGASVEAIAKGISYSKRLLQMRTRNALGTTLGAEVRRIMVDTAAEMLLATDKPITDIAAECGFTSVSHLSLRFRELYGQTPLSFRKSRAH